MSLFILYKNIPQAAAGYAARIGLAPVSLIAPFIGKYHYQRTASSRGWTPPSVSGTDPAAPCLCFNGDGHFLTSSFQPEQAYLRASAGQLRRPPTSCGIVNMSTHDCRCLSKYVTPHSTHAADPVASRPPLPPAFCRFPASFKSRRRNKKIGCAAAFATHPILHNINFNVVRRTATSVSVFCHKPVISPDKSFFSYLIAFKIIARPSTICLLASSGNGCRSLSILSSPRCPVSR